ncbi:MBL fold metallo-hydrolase [Robertkochia aurantiaca]|uniref:MBL fold metallo-hydrolase n=1 Tax=Robertkochia aurantiaca TaxID=2873700 RepID=UPI001CCFD8DF|nr:MBL fold metallo-hydrolase [Robertkochia sp. 3YJGBD-33]
MRIYHLRNASMVLEWKESRLLIDPMLSKAGAFPSFTLLRNNPKRNPVCDLLAETEKFLDGVSRCLITHRHADHIDDAGIAYLRKNRIPVSCSVQDGDHFRKKGLDVDHLIEYHKTSSFMGGRIKGIPALHGYGIVSRLMGNVMGYLIELPGEPSIYLSSDTVLTPEVRQVLTDDQPDISVLAAGTARLDLLAPLLMDKKDILSFIETAPGKVMANHMEGVNHCTTSRTDLREWLSARNLTEKVWIPEDGEMKTYKKTL